MVVKVVRILFKFFRRISPSLPIMSFQPACAAAAWAGGGAVE